MAVDYSALSSLFSAVAAVVTTLGTVALAWISRMRRKDELDARLAARDNPELLKAIVDTAPPPESSLRNHLPIILLVLAIGLTVNAGVHAARQEQFAAAAEAQKKCPGGCPEGSTCNPRNGHCEATARKQPKPRAVSSYPAPDSNLARRMYWEPRDCKLNECAEQSRDEL